MPPCDYALPPPKCMFFTVKLAEDGLDLLVRHVDKLREAVRETKASQPFHIRAIVILPDHLHAIWTLPSGDIDHVSRWDAIRSRFTYALPKLCKTGSDPSAIWREDYRVHEVQGETEKRALTWACWHDPVRHGLVKDPFDWPLSSIHRDDVKGSRAGNVGTRFEDVILAHGQAKPMVDPICA